MSEPNARPEQSARRTRPFELILAWGFVGIPLLWGIAMTLASAVKLF